MKRFLSLSSSEMLKLNAQELFVSLKQSEGRIIVSEMLANDAYLPDCTNAEIARAFAADLILLNIFDFTKPFVKNLPQTNNIVGNLKKLCPRPIGVNLEPSTIVTSGRNASLENFINAQKFGFDFISLTGNPATGVTTESIINAIKIGKKEFSGLIFAGKMHASGKNEDLYSLEAIEKICDAGADVIMLPAPFTIPKSSIENAQKAVNFIHSLGKMAMSTIGTSQETASAETIRQIALSSKMVGFDLHHIGDAGNGGIAPPDNIRTMSDAIRGFRHSLKMIAAVNR